MPLRRARHSVEYGVRQTGLQQWAGSGVVAFLAERASGGTVRVWSWARPGGRSSGRRNPGGTETQRRAALTGGAASIGVATDEELWQWLKAALAKARNVSSWRHDLVVYQTTPKAGK